MRWPEIYEVLLDIDQVRVQQDFGFNFPAKKIVAANDKTRAFFTSKTFISNNRLKLAQK